jgi:hypothetical protein
VRGLRGPTYENWPLGDPRATAPGKYDLKSGENGHLPRANGATGGSYCSPALPSVCGRQFEPLAGWVGWWSWDTELHQRCSRGAWGASSNRVPKKNAGYPGRPTRRREAMRGVFGLAPLFPGGRGEGEQSRCFSQPRGLLNVQEGTRSCARDQVVIARPPVLTPP